MAAFAIVNHCDITAQLSVRADLDHVRTMQQGPEGHPEQHECAQELMGRVCVMLVRPLKQRGKRDMEKQITQLHLCAFGNGGAGTFLRQRYEQINRGHLLFAG